LKSNILAFPERESARDHFIARPARIPAHNECRKATNPRDSPLTARLTSWPKKCHQISRSWGFRLHHFSMTYRISSDQREFNVIGTDHAFFK